MKRMYCRRDMRSEYGVLKSIHYGKLYPKWWINHKYYNQLNKEEKKKWKLCEMNEDDSLYYQ